MTFNYKPQSKFSKEWIPPAYRLAGRYDNPIPPWFLAPIGCLKFQLWAFSPTGSAYSPPSRPPPPPPIQTSPKLVCASTLVLLCFLWPYLIRTTLSVRNTGEAKIRKRTVSDDRDAFILQYCRVSWSLHISCKQRVIPINCERDKQKQRGAKLEYWKCSNWCLFCKYLEKWY